MTLRNFTKSFIRRIIPAGLLELYKCLKNGAFSSLNIFKYRGYKPAGALSSYLLPYVEYVKKGTSIKVKNVFEIGANFAQDADFLMECFGLQPKNVYVFEAHPDIFKAINEIHSFNAYNNAVYNAEKEITFNIFPLDYKDTGWSSIHEGGGGG
jgi:hypothetical protein